MANPGQGRRKMEPFVTVMPVQVRCTGSKKNETCETESIERTASANAGFAASDVVQLTCTPFSLRASHCTLPLAAKTTQERNSGYAPMRRALAILPEAYPEETSTIVDCRKVPMRWLADKNCDPFATHNSVQREVAGSHDRPMAEMLLMARTFFTNAGNNGLSPFTTQVANACVASCTSHHAEVAFATHLMSLIGPSESRIEPDACRWETVIG